MTRLLVLAFSTLVLLSGVACFLLEKDWFNKIPPRAKVPMYMFLGISLCFAVAFSLVDLLNLYSDRCSTFARRGQPLVSSPPQIFLVLAGAILMGALFGLMFGAMDVEVADADLPRARGRHTDGRFVRPHVRRNGRRGRRRVAPKAANGGARVVADRLRAGRD